MSRHWIWVFIAAFGVGLSIDFPVLPRRIAGGFCLVAAVLGFLFGSARVRAPAFAGTAQDLHETVVRDTFAELTPGEAAALAGLLHEHRIRATFADSRGVRVEVEALELWEAARVAASVSGLTAEQVRRLHFRSWRELRAEVAPGLQARLEEHFLVDRLLSHEPL